MTRAASSPEAPFRPERFVLSPTFAAELDRRGQALSGVVHHPDGTATLFCEPASARLEPDHSDDCRCYQCRLEEKLWHSLASEDGVCECPSCVELVREDDARAERMRLLARLRARALLLRGRYQDDLHPEGRCCCGFEGFCAWCEARCLRCGDAPHDGECTEMLASADSVAG